MASVGPYLRELREQKGISLDEVARATRISPRYLEALEADEHSALPERVFTKGFIRAYCQVLGEPPDEAFARFAEDAASVAAPAAPPVAADAPASRMRGTIIVSFVLLLILGAALLALTWALQSSRETADRSGGTTTREARATDPTPTAASSAPTAGPPASPSAPAKPSTPESPVSPPATGQAVKAGSVPPEVKGQGTPVPPAAAPGTPPASSGTPSVLGEVRGLAPPYRLVARAREATWMSVKTKDGRSTEETIPAGETREWASNAPFVVTIGNAGGVSLELNGRSLPALGARGAAVYRIQIPPEAP